jgi:hypothetical protein
VPLPSQPEPRRSFLEAEWDLPSHSLGPEAEPYEQLNRAGRRN